MITTLQRLNIGHFLLINLLFMLGFLAYNTTACNCGMPCGDCVKLKDNAWFSVQAGLNVIFVAFYLSSVDKRKWLMLLIGLFATSFLYAIAAFLHSYLQD